MSVPHPPVPAYQRPSPGYIAGLLHAMRVAHENATRYSREFEAEKAKLLNRTYEDAVTKRFSRGDLSVAERLAVKNQPKLEDAANAYKWWREECDRLSGVIIAEEAARNIIDRYIGEGTIRDDAQQH